MDEKTINITLTRDEALKLSACLEDRICQYLDGMIMSDADSMHTQILNNIQKTIDDQLSDD